MTGETKVVAPGPRARTVRDESDRVVKVPAGWALLPPGDAALTRRVKAIGPSWTVKEKKGRRTYSRGVWAPADQIAAVRVDLAAERSTPAYAKRRQSAAKRREKQHEKYVEEFYGAVVAFLDFAPQHVAMASQLAAAVTRHATPIGSGTVARTERIPIRRRAEAAVIAWLRHHATSYDQMRIARAKGERREVRRRLAVQSRRMLEAYRTGKTPSADCPLKAAIERIPADPMNTLPTTA